MKKIVILPHSTEQFSWNNRYSVISRAFLYSISLLVAVFGMSHKAAAEETNTASPLNESLLLMGIHSLIFVSNV